MSCSTYCHQRFVASLVNCRYLMQRGADPSDREFYGRSLSGIADSNPGGVMDVCLVWVLSGGGLCYGSVTGPDES
jgi:hypothetical protein